MDLCLEKSLAHSSSDICLSLPFVTQALPAVGLRYRFIPSTRILSPGDQIELTNFGHSTEAFHDRTAPKLDFVMLTRV